MSQTGKKCIACGNIFRFLYNANFRIGGTSGGWKIVFGEWAELGEQMLPMEVYACPICGKIELYANQEMKQQFQRESYELK